jgi:hypothetical protein
MRKDTRYRLENYPDKVKGEWVNGRKYDSLRHHKATIKIS